jgi:hypothetical protein
MPSTTTQPRVDVGALAAEIRLGVSDRLAQMLEVAYEACDAKDNPLNSMQKIELTSAMLDVFDGFEREVARDLITDLTSNGVGVWGLSADLGDLLQPGESDA